MKVKCINDDGWTGWLTMGKIYEVIEINDIDGDDYYRIINNKGYNSWYPKRRFKPLSKYRNEKIDKLLK